MKPRFFSSSQRSPKANKSFRPSVRRSSLLLASGLALISACSAQAATLTWNGGGNGTEWSTGTSNSAKGNWGGTAFNNNDNVIFAGTTDLGPTIGSASLTAGSITFNNTSGAFTIGGTATLTINGGVLNNDNSLQSFNVSTITLGASQTWNAGSVSSGGLAFTGTTLNLGASQTLTIDGTNNTSVSNLITGTGTSGILKQGTGTLTLSNAGSTYVGTTTIRAGSLIVGANAPSGSAGALGNTASAVVLGDGSTLASDAPSLLISGGFTVGRAISVGSVANAATYNATIGGSNTTGTSTYSGSITLSNTATNYTATLQAATGGTVDFSTGTWSTNNKAIGIGSSGNTGTVKLSNTLGTTGGISVNFGTFLLGASDRLVDTTPVTVAGGIFDTGTALTDTVSVFNMSSGSLNGTGTITAATYGLSGGTVSGNLGTGTLNSSGTVTLNGTSGTLVVNVTAGTLTTGGTNKLADTAVVTISGGTLTVGGTDTVGSLTMSSGSIGGSSTLTAATYDLSGGTVTGNLGTGTLNSSGTVTLNGTSGTLVVNVTAGTLTTGGTNKLADTAVVTISGGTLTVGGTDTVGSLTMSSGSIGGSSTLTAATYALSGGTVTGNLGIGTLNSSGNVALNGTAGATAVNVTAGTLTLGSADRLDNGATVTVSGGTLALSTFSDTVGAVTLSSGSITGSSGVLTGTSYSLTNSGSVNAILAGAVSLTKTGAGTATLSGVNTYTGVTTISGGVLSVATIGDGGSSSNLGAAAVAAANLVIGNGTLQYTGANASTNRAFTITAGQTATFDITANNLTVSGASATTSGALTKTGAGTLTLSSANTYTGITSINDGSLIVNGSTAGGAVSVAALAKLFGNGTIGGATTILATGTQSSGSSAGAIGNQTFSSGITYNSGSIFEWNLTANTDTSIGTRGTNYDAVNTLSLGATTGAIFRVLLNGSQDFSETFWNANRTWSNIFTNVAGSTNLSIASIFNGGIQYYNASGVLTSPAATQGSFTFNGTDLNWTVVPEPTSALAGILLGAGLLRRKRDQRRSA